MCVSKTPPLAYENENSVKGKHNLVEKICKPLK